MAVYKVPQDVEADDKLIGPFSFRQFIYLIIVALAGVGAWGLFQLFPPLAVIPLPVIVFFGALALPLRKDQPMEVYMAAIVSFYIKPRKRLWKPDGQTSLIEVVAPRSAEVNRTKALSQNEAEQRLSYLAKVVDSQGWSVRGVGAPAVNSAMNSDAYFAAQQAEDILDDNTSLSQNLDHMIDEADVRRRQEMIDRMHTPVQSPVPTPATVPQPAASAYDPIVSPASPVSPSPTPAEEPEPQLEYNPYPSSIHQSVIRPMSDQPPIAPIQPVIPQPVPTTSAKPVSPDIINLANQHDLSIAAMQREANRITQKQQAEDEVVISLR